MNMSAWSRSRWWGVVVMLSTTLLSIDYVTGPFILFPITFVFPVALAGWFLGRWSAMALAVTLSMARFVWVTAWGIPQFGWLVALVNALVDLVVLVLLGFLVDLVARQQRSLDRRVQTLEGLLPICSFCKKIRKPDGVWEAVEVYVTARSDAQFSHGLCEACIRQHYPEVFATDAHRPVDPGTAPEPAGG